jgi:hypothetical protein
MFAICSFGDLIPVIPKGRIHPRFVQRNKIVSTLGRVARKVRRRRPALGLRSVTESPGTLPPLLLEQERPSRPRCCLKNSQKRRTALKLRQLALDPAQHQTGCKKSRHLDLAVHIDEWLSSQRPRTPQ